MEVRIFRDTDIDNLTNRVNKAIHDLNVNQCLPEIISTTTVAVGNLNMGLQSETTIILLIRRSWH